MAKKKTSYSVNSFEGGMNKDLSKTIHSKNTYTDGLNIRPFTDDDGLANGGVVNILGNDLKFTIPDTSPVWRFDTLFTDPYPTTVALSVTIGANLFNDVFTVSGTSPSEVRDSLVSEINLNLHYINNNIFAAAEGLSSVVLYNTGSSTASWSTVDPNISNLAIFIVAQSGLSIVGWTTIRDDFIIFTTNETGSSPNSYGQVWRLIIDQINETISIKLVYNNLLNFSSEYPIEAIGRYETNSIQKVYWTDNYNSVKSLNVSDIGSLGLSPDSLSISPNKISDVPVVSSVDINGQLKTGVYQYSYRLKTTSGSESSFSMLSRQVSVLSSSESSTNFWEYIGVDSGITTSKSVSIIINNVDINFDLIEVVSIYKSSKYSSPVITSISIDSVPSDGIYRYTHSGTESSSYSISSDEFLLGSNGISKAKTLTVKDNRLFLGNITTSKFDVNVDCRAYAHAINSANFSIDGTVEIDPLTISPTANAINDNTYVYKFKKNSTTYGGTGTYINYEIKTESYRADVRKLQISSNGYDAMPIYTQIDPPVVNPVDLLEGRVYPQTSSMAESYKENITFGLKKGYQRSEIYRFGIVFFDKSGNPGFANWIADIKIPDVHDVGRSAYGASQYINGSFNGKILEDLDPSGLNQIVLQNFNRCYIEFSVNLPSSILDSISGYSIVRTERTKNDKTIVAQGLSIPTGPKIEIDENAGANPPIATPIGPLVDGKFYAFTFNNEQSWFNRRRDYANDANSESLTVKDTIKTVAYDSNYQGLIFPEHTLTEELNFLSGDVLRTVDVVNAKYGVTDAFYRPDTSYADKGSILFKKFSDTQTTFKNYGAQSSATILNMWKLSEGEEIEIDNSITLRNETCSPFNSSGTAKPQHWGYGGKLIYVKCSGPLHVYGGAIGDNTEIGSQNTAVDFDATRMNMLIVNYTRTLINQYGGNTFAKRSANKYISTGNFISVEYGVPASTLFKVFGGDIFLGLYDSQVVRKVWNWQDNNSQILEGTSMISGAKDKISRTYIFPVESQINVSLRSGKFVGANGLTDLNSNTDSAINNSTLSGSCDLGEDYKYNTSFSSEDNLLSFFSKPINFTENLEYDTRIFSSDPKINGEPSDSWTYFRTLNFYDVEARYGPINRILTHNDTFFSFQDNAIASISVNPRIAIQGSDGVNIELGTGTVLYDHVYASTNIGSKHQWGVVSSNKFIYWIDVLSNRMYRLSRDSGIQSLSDIKGFNSYFADNLKGDVRLDEKNSGDNPLKLKGILCYYDSENNEIGFTIGGAKRIHSVTEASIITFNYIPGDYIAYDAGPFISYYEVTNIFLYSGIASLAGNTVQIPDINKNYFCLIYNENIDAFSSFSSNVSNIYLYKNGFILNPDPSNPQSIYMLNRGERCKFFGSIKDSSLEFISNDLPLETKVFNNLEWVSESTDSAKNDLENETFTSAICSTDYQSTGIIPLSNSINLKRRERSWQFTIPRNTKQVDRIRDKNMTIKFIYSNNNNARLLLSHVKTFYMYSPR